MLTSHSGTESSLGTTQSALACYTWVPLTLDKPVWTGAKQVQHPHALYEPAPTKSAKLVS